MGKRGVRARSDVLRSGSLQTPCVLMLLISIDPFAFFVLIEEGLVFNLDWFDKAQFPHMITACAPSEGLEIFREKLRALEAELLILYLLHIDSYKLQPHKQVSFVGFIFNNLTITMEECAETLPHRNCNEGSHGVKKPKRRSSQQDFRIKVDDVDVGGPEGLNGGTD